MFSLFVWSDKTTFVILIKLRQYGGLSGINNSSLVKHLKHSKTLRLNEVLPDAEECTSFIKRVLRTAARLPGTATTNFEKI